jgi:hypothetical protein
LSNVLEIDEEEELALRNLNVTWNLRKSKEIESKKNILKGEKAALAVKRNDTSLLVTNTNIFPSRFRRLK